LLRKLKKCLTLHPILLCIIHQQKKQILTYATQKQPKQPQSLSPLPDLHQLSDSEWLGEDDLDLPINDHVDLDVDLFDYCFAQMEKEFDERGELIGQEEANTLYEVSNVDPKLTMMF
jgi:hypothetical protein